MPFMGVYGIAAGYENAGHCGVSAGIAGKVHPTYMNNTESPLLGWVFGFLLLGLDMGRARRGGGLFV